MIILSSPEDDPRERRPGGGEQAPVRAPVRARAPCATPPAPGGAPYPSETPGFWDHAQARARPLGPRRRQNSGSRTGWGRGAGGPSLSVQKCVHRAPPRGRGRTPECVRSAYGARAERAWSACALRSALGARTGRVRSAHGARTACVRTPECASERVRSGRGMRTECVRAPECVRSAYGARAERARSACALRSAYGARADRLGDPARLHAHADAARDDGSCPRLQRRWRFRRRLGGWCACWRWGASRHDARLARTTD